MITRIRMRIGLLSEKAKTNRQLSSSSLIRFHRLPSFWKIVRIMKHCRGRQWTTPSSPSNSAHPTIQSPSWTSKNSPSKMPRRRGISNPFWKMMTKRLGSMKSWRRNSIISRRAPDTHSWNARPKTPISGRDPISTCRTTSRPHPKVSRSKNRQCFPRSRHPQQKTQYKSQQEQNRQKCRETTSPMISLCPALIRV